jgi:hypothetical protein
MIQAEKQRAFRNLSVIETMKNELVDLKKGDL